MANILCLIPARAGSKRIPGKNTRLLGPFPLVEHTIRAAIKASCFSSIVVSSDSEAVLSIVQAYPEVIGMSRFAKNGSDCATVADVLDEVLFRLGDFGLTRPDAVLVLQPTSPFRKVSTILQAVALHELHSKDSIISVSPAATHPYWCKRVSEDGILSDFSIFEESVQSQGLPDAYALNGAIYLCSVDNFLKSRSLYSKNTRALVMDSAVESLDIDTPDDWLIAEAVYESLKQRGDLN